jgi:hypothetical protein
MSHFAEAIFCDLSQIGVWALRDDSREDGLHRSGLDQNSSAKRLTEAIEFPAAGSLHPICPRYDVVFLEQAISHKLAFTGPVRATIG